MKPSRSVSPMYRAILLAALAVLVAVSPGCLVRRLRVVRPGIKQNEKLQTATLDQLVARLKAGNRQIQTLTVTVDLEPWIGTVLKGELSELKEVRGFVLIRKPSMIRVIGLYPVVRTQAFDMVSNGITFGLYVPIKNKFIVGNNALETPSPKNLENLRPQHMFEAIVVQPPREGERAVLENDTDEADAFYIIHLIKEQSSRLVLSRNLWFDRVHLLLARQQIFDGAGDIVSDDRYADYDNIHGIAFPKQISIMRPKDEYGARLKVVKVELNQPLADDKFALTQPPGTELVDLTAPKRPALQLP